MKMRNLEDLYTSVAWTHVPESDLKMHGYHPNELALRTNRNGSQVAVLILNPSSNGKAFFLSKKALDDLVAGEKEKRLCRSYVALVNKREVIAKVTAKCMQARLANTPPRVSNGQGSYWLICKEMFPIRKGDGTPDGIRIPF
jgi:hypothetical protein